VSQQSLESTATFSPHRTYRYSLWRRWGDEAAGYVMFIGLNPNTADELKDDPTVRRCIQYAKDWGYGAICMTNIFAFRETDPAVMKAHPSPVGPENDATLSHLAAQAQLVVAAWGTDGAHMGRQAEVRRLLPNLHCLSRTKEGFPGHPLYLKKTLRPMPY
jgi:hypothetical protein